MKKHNFLTLLLALFFLASCSNDDDGGEQLADFTVSFANGTISLSETDTTQEVALSFSRAATEAGVITIGYTGDNAVYGTDFTTSPSGESGSISVPVAVGDTNATITFTKLQDPVEGTTKSVDFSIDGFDNSEWVEGTANSVLVSFTPIAALSGIIDLETGGPTQPNQVYFDFSTGVQTAVQRDTWEIAVYNGDENVTFLNSSLLVSAAELPGITDLLSVTESTILNEPIELNKFDVNTFQSTTVTVTDVAELIEGLPFGFYSQYGNSAEGIIFTDNREGTLDGTAFSEISTTAEENNVYIVNLGNAIPAEHSGDPGGITTTGDLRGYMKVRILTDGNSYTIQYAALDETTNFSEVTITKDAGYGLTAFSLTDGATVQVEPALTDWDINFSGVFSFYGLLGGAETGLTYSDYNVHNTLGGVGLYQVTLYETDGDGNVTQFDVPSYADFSIDDVDESSLVYDDRSVIGSGWRTSGFGGTPGVKDDRYYILKDADGNYYKMLFTALLSAEGERGNTQFTYERL